jgi:hypothetical protein
VDGRRHIGIYPQVPHEDPLDSSDTSGILSDNRTFVHSSPRDVGAGKIDNVHS